ncbi:TPA: hypothetical protein JAX41_004748 [Enterobacter roggenkampii]|nr:hypothetical protein [Enterobacter roggenkampii]
MENVGTLEIKGTLHIAANEFVFDLSQLVELNVSDEFGEVAARAQYAHGENQYYIHYKAADGCAKTEWFAEHQLSAVEDDRHPGCRVYGARELPPGAVAIDDEVAKQS